MASFSSIVRGAFSPTAYRAPRDAPGTQGPGYNAGGYTPGTTRGQRLLDRVNAVINPRVKRTGAAGLANTFLNPQIKRTGRMGYLNAFLNPQVKRTGRTGFVNEFLNPRATAFRAAKRFLRRLPRFIAKKVRQAKSAQRRRAAATDRAQDAQRITMQRLERGLQTYFKSYNREAIESLAQRVSKADPTVKTYLFRALETRIEASRAAFVQAAKDYDVGKISSAQLYNRMFKDIKVLNYTATVLGAGGTGNLTNEDIYDVQARVLTQARYLRGFVDDMERKVGIRGGALDGRDFNRAALYANSARATAQAAERRFLTRELGAQVEERRVLSADESCPGCEEQASLGWQPIGVLEPIGSQECGPNCKCSFESRDPASETNSAVVT